MADNRNKHSSTQKINSKTISPIAPSRGTVQKKSKNSIKLDAYSQLNDTETVDIRYLLQTLTEVKNGNFGVRMPIDQTGLSGKVCDTLNDIIALNQQMMLEFTRAIP